MINGTDYPRCGHGASAQVAGLGCAACLGNQRDALRQMVRAICDESPPDDWDPFIDGYSGYGSRGDPCFVDEPDESNSGDVHRHGDATGTWDVAKRLRGILKTGIPSPRVFLDGDQWCALYGTDLQSGVAAFGANPEAARAAFVKKWRGSRSAT